MSYAIFRRHKVLTSICVGGLASGLYLLNDNRRIHFYEEFHRYTRTVDFAFTVATILGDYKYSFRNATQGTDKYEKLYHEVNQRCAEKTLKLCRRLGGYYMKIGQMISTLDQGIPREWINTLSLCQDKATPVPFSSVSRVFDEDLGISPYSIFREIDEKPIGCASLAQVHRAVLKTGEVVALKIQYPFIRKYTLTDLRDCELATKVIKYLFPTFEFTILVYSAIQEECEMTNMTHCRDFFSQSTSIYIPKVYPEFSSDRILIMEYIDGVKVNNVSAIRQMGIDPRDVAKLCVSAFADMIFQAPFLHVDPHPGNLLVRHIPGSVSPQLVILDHGMYNYIDEGFATFFQNLWLAMVAQDTPQVEELCRQYGMDGYAQLLSLALTGRSMMARNKFGEELDEDLRESVEDRVTMALQSLNIDIFSRRVGVLSDMMGKMPKDLMYVFRVVEMMRGLLRLLGGKESDRLSIMTSSAIQGKYCHDQSMIPFIVTVRWKLYLYFLRLRLWLNDIYIEFYLRYYLKQGFDMEFDPDVIFDSLIKTRKQ